MNLRAYDPSARGLRRFVLLVIFAITLPSLILTGFGLIAIQNERHATHKRVKDLYAPVTKKMAQRVQEYLSRLVSESLQPLNHLSAWSRREVSFCEDLMGVFKHNAKWIASNFFVIHDRQGPLLPRSEIPDPSWQGFLPNQYHRAQVLEFQKNDLAGAIAIYKDTLNDLSGSNPLRCIGLNALGRSSAKAGHYKDTVYAYDLLVKDCPNFVDAGGYNLALGAMLHRIQLAGRTNPESVVDLSFGLSYLLSDPDLAASADQVHTVAEETLKVLKKIDRKKAASAIDWLNSISSRQAILDQFNDLVHRPQNKVSLEVFRVGGTRRVFLVNYSLDPNGIKIVSGCELIPAGLDLLLSDLLKEMEVEGVVAHIRPSELDYEEVELVAGIALLKDTDLAWRLDIDLADKDTLEKLSNNRTRLYMWILVLLIMALALGIAKTIHFVIRETRLSRLKTDFVSSVSHELRTPLTSIRMFTETLLLGRVRDKKEMTECLETIGKETERLSRLVERILDFSRMEAGRKAFQFRPEQLNNLVRTAITTCRPMIEESGFAIKTRLEEHLPEVRMDHDAMVEVVVNLLSNAMKYSTDVRKVEIQTQTCDEYIELSVSDHGIGIPKTEHKKIFEKFHRVDTPLSTSVSGSGLGLSLVAYIIRAHQGQVSVDSSPGSGSTFIVRLPNHVGTESKNGADE